MIRTPSPTRSADRWFTVVDGVRLRQLRRQHGLSPAELAGKAGIGLSTVTSARTSAPAFLPDPHRGPPRRRAGPVTAPLSPVASHRPVMPPAETPCWVSRAPAGTGAVPAGPAPAGRADRQAGRQPHGVVRTEAVADRDRPDRAARPGCPGHVHGLRCPARSDPGTGRAGRANPGDGWWRAYGGTIPDDFGIYTALEDAACALAVYAPGQIPGLLRTEAYARTLISSTGLGGEEADRLVYDCLARRVLLTRARSPLMMTVALDEALVHRPVGGPAVMAGQLRFLADMAALPNVCLRVVPYAAGLHPGLATGAFTLLHFPPSNRGSDSDTAIVYAEGLTGELYLDKPHEVQRYRDAHAAILACALDETAHPGHAAGRRQRPGALSRLPFGLPR